MNAASAAAELFSRDNVEDLPRAHGVPPVSGVIRRHPEDFIVEEVLKFEPTGSGEHVFMWVEKRGANTDWVARQIARALGAKRGDVAYAGMKDRHAVTRQWFSVGGVRDEALDLSALGDGEWRVLHAVRHNKKLRHGAIKANRFCITVRDIEGDRDAFAQRLASVEREGVPNYFGEQRFGHDNIGQADAWARGTVAPPDDHTRGIWLSVLRSVLFNRVLAMRVIAGCWNKMLRGDAAILTGSRSFFVVDECSEEIVDRCARFDIAPSGPLWGQGESPVRAAAAAFEEAISSVAPAHWLAAMAQAGLEQERRPLVLSLGAPQLEWHGTEAATLKFELATGNYATVVLRELIAMP